MTTLKQRRSNTGRKDYVEPCYDCFVRIADTCNSVPFDVEFYLTSSAVWCMLHHWYFQDRSSWKFSAVWRLLLFDVCCISINRFQDSALELGNSLVLRFIESLKPFEHVKHPIEIWPALICPMASSQLTKGRSAAEMRVTYDSYLPDGFKFQYPSLPWSTWRLAEYNTLNHILRADS